MCWNLHLEGVKRWKNKNKNRSLCMFLFFIMCVCCKHTLTHAQQIHPHICTMSLLAWQEGHSQPVRFLMGATQRQTKPLQWSYKTANDKHLNTPLAILKNFIFLQQGPLHPNAFISFKSCPSWKSCAQLLSSIPQTSKHRKENLLKVIILCILKCFSAVPGCKSFK